MDNQESIIANEEKKKKVVKAVVKKEFEFTSKNDTLTNYKRIPLEDVAALGVGWESLASEIKSLFGNGQAGSGLYKVIVPDGGQLMPFKNEKAFLGSVKSATGAVGGGQARLVPLSIDPASLCTALALMNVEAKLNKLQDLSLEILSYLKEKDRAELEGALSYLIETWNTYKYNWDNETFTHSALNQVQVIKKDTLAQITLVRKQIIQKIYSKTYFSSKKVREKTKGLQYLFETYQLAVYVYSMSVFLEAVLLGNYRKDFLEEEIERIENTASGCTDLQRKVYMALKNNQKYAEVAKELGWSILEAGTLFMPWTKLPNLNNVDIARIARTVHPLIRDIGDIDKASSSNKGRKLIEEFFDDIREETGVFIESINELSDSYSSPPQMLVDSEYLYIEEPGCDQEDGDL